MDYYIKGADGEYTLVTDKLVPESDLLTVKGSAESRQKQLTDQVDGLKDQLDKMTVRATEAESAVNTVKGELEPLKIEAAKVPTLETQVRELTDKSSAAETQLLTTKRTAFIDKYQIADPTKKSQVESMSEADLTQYEKAFELAGWKPNQPNGNGGFNNASVKAGDTSSLSGSEKMRLGLEQGLLASGKE